VRSLLAFLLCLISSVLQAETIVTVGDSLVQTYPSNYPIWGWGQTLPALLPQFTWLNLAVSGESSKSFIDEGLWANVLALHPNRILIEFGHNDSHLTDPAHYTDPSTTFSANFARFADDARAAGALPIFVTPVARRGGPANDDTLPLYSAAMISVARQKDVQVVDLHAATLALYDSLGTSAQTIVGPSGGFAQDVTHLGHNGAQLVAGIIAPRIAVSEPSTAVLLVFAVLCLFLLEYHARRFHFAYLPRFGFIRLRLLGGAPSRAA